MERDKRNYHGQISRDKVWITNGRVIQKSHKSDTGKPLKIDNIHLRILFANTFYY